MDPRIDELRAAHDVLAEVYAEVLVDHLDRMPIERALLSLLAELVHAAGGGTEVGDIGCGTGRLAPYLTAQGLTPHGVDLSLEMVKVARRDHPVHDFTLGDLRALPFGDASLDAAVAWYSLMYLDAADRQAAFAEIARVVRPGGYFATAYKVGDDSLRRGGQTLDLGIGFDIWWHSPAEVEERCAEAGFEVVLTAGRPADPDELQPQGYLIARRVW